MALTQAPEIDMGDGYVLDLSTGIAKNATPMDEYGNLPPPKQLTTAQLAPYLATWNSQQPGRDLAAQQDAANSGGLGDFFHGLLKAAPLALTAGAFGAGLSGLAGGSGITADSIGAGITGGENAAGAMYGTGTGATGLAGAADAPWGVNPQGGSMNVGSYNPSDPFGLGSNAAPNYGSISGFNPGDFTASMLPGGYLSATAGGMVDLGGVGGVAGVQAALESQAPGLWQKLLTQVGNNPLQAAQMGASLLGKLGGAALSYFGGQKQAGALQSLAQSNLQFGAPSRARFEASMTPGFDPMSIPGYSGALDTTSKSVLAKLSATGGNPFGNPGGLIDANKQIIAGTSLPAIQNYQNENLNAGYGPGFGASNAAATGAINANAGSLTGAAGALGQLTSPDNSLAGLIAQLKAQGVNIGSGSGFNLSNGNGL